MFLKLFNVKDGVFQPKYRTQLLAALTVCTLSLSHGIGLGWLAPMLPKLQSSENNPLNFIINLEETSWFAAFISVGGLIGNMLYGLIIDLIGRRRALYSLAFPHISVWFLYYFANSVECLYLARICGGITGGGSYVVIPIFLSEIADPIIRGRLTSMFMLSLNSGIFLGYILSTTLPYHLIPWLVLLLPTLYLIFLTFLMETPQHLLRCGQEEQAEKSLKYYKNFNDLSKEDIQESKKTFSDLKEAVKFQKAEGANISFRDFLTKASVKALLSGIFLMFINIFCGVFALINYMSNVFAETKTPLHPDINTIIIGLIQVVGSYIATFLVDKYGRKILMIISTSSMAFMLSIFGVYVHLAQTTEIDLSAVNWWLPLLLMALIIFFCNVGLNSVLFVVLIEIMPSKIRSKASALCLSILSVFAFTLVKIFPIFWNAVGLATTMWCCASVCALGFLYTTIILKETKGKSLDKVEADN